MRRVEREDDKEHRHNSGIDEAELAEPKNAGGLDFPSHQTLFRKGCDCECAQNVGEERRESDRNSPKPKVSDAEPCKNRANGLSFKKNADKFNVISRVSSFDFCLLGNTEIGLQFRFLR